LSREILKSLREHFQTPPDAAKVIVLKSSDPRVFCSGHDINDFHRPGVAPSENRRSHEDLFDLCQATMIAVKRCPIPTLASVGGAATGAGLQLVASCDLALADKETARFSTPGVGLGLFCSTPSVPLLASGVSRKAAMEMLFTGEFVSAQRAAEIGLITRSTTSLSSCTDSLASAVARGSPEAVRVGKASIMRREGMGLEDAYGVASATMVENLEEDDAKEGIKAFLEKRQPMWPSNKKEGEAA